MGCLFTWLASSWRLHQETFIALGNFPWLNAFPGLYRFRTWIFCQHIMNSSTFQDRFFYLFIYLCLIYSLAALDLCCCMRAFSSCGEWGLLFVVVCGLIVVASLVAEHGLQACGLQQLWRTGSVVVARGLQSTGSVVVAHRLSCSTACGIFLDQGSNPSPLHQQADS